ncbi:putative nonselective cation channel [Colletotrichum karsti]|uniref:Nonselective cation channel n=1 Tax=Colletotrichum karsti TaxID=1095194 RepID=A0A9P6LMA6_9PEZI|nr:putative nonselective cation channel [Colletotrichum karsti]KAF9878175.1 putative nonselective cation channel [Colletotrichum karsti]
MYLRRRRTLKPDMRRSEQMDEDKLWSPREERPKLSPRLLDDEDEDGPGAAGGSETEACLGDEGEGVEEEKALPIYVSMHRVRRLIIASIDDPYTLDQLSDPRLNVLIVRPLVDRLYNPKDITIVYCLLANRLYFLRQQATTVHQPVNIARATLCELVATRTLRRFHEDNPGSQGLLFLSHILVGGFDPFQGAPEAVEFEGRRQWAVQERGGLERKLTALELAILSESKTFISSAGCQRVVNAVYEGRVIYTPLSFVDILPDHYKYHPISLYDPRKAPILNHYRLIVPRSRNLIEFIQFLILMVLYFLAMLYRRSSNEVFEFLFCIYAAGWVLDELAAIVEHGWEVHAQNLWSWLDVTFSFIYGAYVVARVFDVAAGRFPDGHGLHVLPLAAPILLTRAAFNIAPDNIVLISLHAMMKDFMLLSLLACWCFMGFLLALQWLIDSNDNPNETPSWFTICKWMLWIWFGLDGTGIEESVQFHVALGPALMIGFAFLGNTLFLTILVAMLTNTFSKIIADETAEVQFRRAVLTFEGVKSDAIFAYPPPFNVFALATLLPLRFAVSAETFHRVNVALVRVLNLPTLLVISLYERRQFSRRQRGRRTRNGLLGWRQFSGFSPHGDIQAVFETRPPPDVADLIEGLDRLDEKDEDGVTERGRSGRWRSRVRAGTLEHDE